MQPSFLSRQPVGTLHPLPAQEQARLHRMIESHRRPGRPFDGLLTAGSFNRDAAGSIGVAREADGAASGRDVKLPFTLAF